MKSTTRKVLLFIRITNHLFSTLKKQKMNKQKNVQYFLGDSFSLKDVNGNLYIHSDFKPQSFSLFDRRNRDFLINKDEADYAKWLSGVISDFYDRCVLEKNRNNRKNIIDDVVKDIDVLLNTELNGVKLEHLIWNQEFPDIAYKVFTSVLDKHNVLYQHSHEQFNQFSLDFIPKVIEKNLLNESIKTLLKYSIASGISGLDLKGTTAAASKLNNSGIEMAPYLERMPEDSIDDYFNKLSEKALNPDSVLEVDTFISDIKSNKLLIWFTDDIIESCFDLFLIQKILLEYDNMNVVVIPKNGSHCNDLSWEQLEMLLSKELYKPLRKLAALGRFWWSKNGPDMGAMNLSKISPEIRGLIQISDFAFIKGCRIHELINGAFPIPYYSGFIVSRSSSEIISGFSAEKSPLLFFKTHKNQYSFYNIYDIINDKINISIERSTIKDYLMRKELTEGGKIVIELKKLLKQYHEKREKDKRPILFDILFLSEKLIEITKFTYNSQHKQYTNVRWSEPHDLDKKLWERLLHTYNSIHTEKINEKIRLLDVATGNGRDLIYAQKTLGIDAVGIDNSESFISDVKQLEKEGKISPNSIFIGDMRDLSMFDSESFDIVRHNASILHMPFVEKEYLADKAMSEAYKLLRKKGLLYVNTKKGDDIEFVDTKEGLGGRFFQFYNEDNLSTLLIRNGFRILNISTEKELRNNDIVEWLCAIALKV